MLQRLPFQQFHGNEGLAVAFFNVVNRADVGMIQSGRGTSFALESFQGLVVFRKFLRQEFQSDEATQLGVLGLIDHTHAAATELLQDAIVRDGCADHLGVTFLKYFLSRA